MSEQEERAERDVLIEFVQKVAAQHRRVCKLDHHAATCVGAIQLADAAARLLTGLGIEVRKPSEPHWHEPCPLCGENEYVIGQIWVTRWVHATCIERLEARSPGGESNE